MSELIQHGATGLPVVMLSASAVREQLPTIDLQYDYHAKLRALESYTKDRRCAIAALEAQVAMAQTLPEAMERGDVRTEYGGKGYVLSKLDNVISPAVVNRWRKLAAVPEDKRLAYYEQPGRPTRNGLLAWCEESPRPDYETPQDCRIVESLQELINAGDRFACIYADPPWAYTNAATRATVVPTKSQNGKHGKASAYKSVMTVEDICDEPVVELAADECHLYLWTTTSFLPDAFRVIEAWGFTYKSNMVWVKPQMGIGNYIRVCHEHLLIAVKGKTRTNGRNQRSWIEADRTRHSCKPLAFRQVVEAMSQGPYLELYGREPIEGWTVYGNEVARGLFDN